MTLPRQPARATRWDRAYAGVPVLVVGGFGFIGVNLARRLHAIGASVTVLTREREAHAAQASAFDAAGVRVLEGDLRDPAHARAAVAGQAVVFNMSGRSGAVRSLDDPLTDLDVNCRGNLVLLEAVRAIEPSAKFVFPGSRLVYGHPAATPVGEADPLKPQSIHAIHKAAIEDYVAIYQRVHGLHATIARITNPYGPGQPAGRRAYGIVNRFVHLALAGEPLVVYGDGAQLRDYIYIEDLVDALVGIGADRATDGRTYNIGSGVATSFVAMARAVIAATGGGSLQFEAWPPLAAQVETGDFVADISRLRGDIGWAPATPLADGLRLSVDAYRGAPQV